MIRKAEHIPKELEEFDDVMEMNLHDNECGIYMLYLDSELQYIGKSINIYNRVLTHKRSSGHDEKRFNRTLFIRCKCNELDELEKSLIIKHQPPLNRTGNPKYYKDRNSLSYRISELKRIEQVREKAKREEIYKAELKERRILYEFTQTSYYNNLSEKNKKLVVMNYFK